MPIPKKIRLDHQRLKVLKLKMATWTTAEALEVNRILSSRTDGRPFQFAEGRAMQVLAAEIEPQNKASKQPQNTCKHFCPHGKPYDKICRPCEEIRIAAEPRVPL